MKNGWRENFPAFPLITQSTFLSLLYYFFYYSFVICNINSKKKRTIFDFSQYWRKYSIYLPMTCLDLDNAECRVFYLIYGSWYSRFWLFRNQSHKFSKLPGVSIIQERIHHTNISSFQITNHFNDKNNETFIKYAPQIWTNFSIKNFLFHFSIFHLNIFPNQQKKYLNNISI